MNNYVSAPFRLGHKNVFLPSFKITLINTPHASPYMASFDVPLNMNKLDLRDYLYHAYNVKVLSVRSFIKQAPVTQGTGRQQRPTPNQWHRGRAKKRMTVELEKPFVWPQAYTEEELQSGWNKQTFRKAEKSQAENQERYSLPDAWKNVTQREKMREQAQKILSGKQKWTPGVGQEQYYINNTTPRWSERSS